MSLFQKRIPKRKTRYQNKINKSLPLRSIFYDKQLCLKNNLKEAPRYTCKASFTLEAAVVIPLLACLFVSLLFFFRVMQVQLEVQQILDETSRKLAVYASASEIVTKEDDTLLLGAINLGLAKTLFTKELNEQTLAAEWIYGGTNGVSLLSSKVSGDYIDLVATYRIQLPIQLPVPYEFKIIQRSCSRKWTGYQPIEEGEEDVWVYITKTGTVYHTTKSCSYLDLSIQSVFYAGVEAYRSKSGGKYHACPLCVEENAVTQKVYITNYGDCYHADLNCSGIKRTIYMVRLTETEGRKACSKCGSGGVGT